MEQFLQAIGTIAGVFFFGLLIAFTIERLVEKLATWPLEQAGLPSELKAYIAWVFGGAFSGAFAIDLFTPVAIAVGLEPFVPAAGYVLTALAVGGGSQILHDIFGAYVQQAEQPAQ